MGYDAPSVGYDRHRVDTELRLICGVRYDVESAALGFDLISCFTTSFNTSPV